MVKITGIMGEPLRSNKYVITPS